MHIDRPRAIFVDVWCGFMAYVCHDIVTTSITAMICCDNYKLHIEFKHPTLKNENNGSKHV